MCVLGIACMMWDSTLSLCMWVWRTLEWMCLGLPVYCGPLLGVCVRACLCSRGNPNTLCCRPLLCVCVLERLCNVYVGGGHCVVGFVRIHFVLVGLSNVCMLGVPLCWGTCGTMVQCVKRGKQEFHARERERENARMPCLCWRQVEGCKNGMPVLEISWACFRDVAVLVLVTSSSPQLAILALFPMVLLLLKFHSWLCNL